MISDTRRRSISFHTHFPLSNSNEILPGVANISFNTWVNVGWGWRKHVELYRPTTSIWKEKKWLERKEIYETHMRFLRQFLRKGIQAFSVDDYCTTVVHQKHLNIQFDPVTMESKCAPHPVFLISNHHSLCIVLLPSLLPKSPVFHAIDTVDATHRLSVVRTPDGKRRRPLHYVP